jgi:hypothetical protein
MDGDTYFVDCALTSLDGEETFPAWLEEALAALPAYTIPEAGPGLEVSKRGATTGTTQGILVDVAYPDLPVIEGRAWQAPGQLLIDSRDPLLNFSAPGDSGAAVVDAAGAVIGLLWGSNDFGQGIACPIAPVFACLDVEGTAARAATRRKT